MRLAFEAPTEDTELALELSDYIFAIASKLGDHRYSTAVSCARGEGKEMYLDNGAYEGELLDVDSLVELCRAWKPEVIVTPDIIGDCDKTLELTSEFALKIRKESRVPKLLGVLQGKNFEEKYWCYEEFLRLGIDIIGLGLAAFEKNWRERIAFFKCRVGEKMPVHVLGIANIHDLCFWKPLVETIDTSLPFHLAQEGKNLFEAKETKRIDWEAQLSPSQLSQLAQNITLLRGTLRHV